MKNTVMKCDCCGTTFEIKYYQGGYIDHVNNFVGNQHVFVNKDVTRVAREIVFCNGAVRCIDDIEKRLKCFMTWNGFQDDFKLRVKRIVDAMLKEIKSAHTKAYMLRDKTPPLVFSIAIADIHQYYRVCESIFEYCCKEVNGNGGQTEAD